MSDAPFNEEGKPESTSGGTSESLDDLDSLLASAADLAGELAQEVGSEESATAVADLDEAFLAEQRDALANLDERLSEVSQLTDRAVAEVGAVESVSGDAQILGAMQSSPSAPTEPTALSAPDKAFLADLDDLTVNTGAGQVDAFGAPPPRGGGPVEPVPAPSAPRVEADAASSIDDLTAPAAEQPSTADATAEAGEAGRAASSSMAARLARTILAPVVLLARAGVWGLEMFDKGFFWVPAGLRTIAGWLGFGTLVLACGLWIWILMRHP